jgi:hypothetical protein
VAKSAQAACSPVAVIAGDALAGGRVSRAPVRACIRHRGIRAACLALGAHLSVAVKSSVARAVDDIHQIPTAAYAGCNRIRVARLARRAFCSVAVEARIACALNRIIRAAWNSRMRNDSVIIRRRTKKLENIHRATWNART